MPAQPTEQTTMRSNYSPYEQMPANALAASNAEIELAKRQVQQANDNLSKVLEAHIPLMLRHHTDQRGLIKLGIDQLKRELQASNAARVTALDFAWASTMADIEAKRAAYHATQAQNAEQRRIKREERATLTHDPSINQYYIMRTENVAGADGIVKPTQRKVYLPEDHEYLK